MTRVEPLSEDLLGSWMPDVMALDRLIDAEPWREAEFFLALPEKFRHSRLAFEGVALVGFAVASRKIDAVHLHRLAVSAEHRGRGVGRELLLSVAASARANGVLRMTLKVPAGNHDARVFYRRLGFREEGTAGDNVCLATETEFLATPPGVVKSG